MEDQERLNNIFFGLIGKNISYSFSKTYFSKTYETALDAPPVPSIRALL